MEIQWSFELPKGAIIHDSWLWIDDSIVVADLLDRWTATTIYEGIVNRRQDPSLLVKESETQYSLNVYPIVAEGSRKLKISFLMPAMLRQNKVNTIIPVSFITDNGADMNDLSLYLHETDEWNTPELINSTLIAEQGDGFVKYNITKYQLNNETLVGSFSPKNEENYYASVYKERDEHYYQISLYPGEATPTRGHHFYVIDQYGYEIEKTELIDLLKKHIHMNASSQDSVTIIYYNGSVQSISGTGAEINSLVSNNILDGSSAGNGYSLLLNAIKAYNNSETPGKILFMSDVYASRQDSNWAKTVNWLYETFDSVPPINTINTYYNNYYDYYDYWDYYYYGDQTNEYLKEVSKRTGGDYLEISNKSDLLDQLYQTFNTNNIEKSSTYMSFTDGFTFDTFQTEEKSGVLQEVGRFIGDLPATIELNRLMTDGTVVQENIELTLENVSDSDSLLRKYWAGCVIAELEQNATNDNQTKRDIIKTSLENRILSEQTAFLALDPKLNLKPEACEDCVYDQYNWMEPMWGMMITVVEQTAVASSSFSVYPQPLTEQSALHSELADGEVIKSVKLYNANGILVKVYPTGAFDEEILLEITENGMYILEILTNKSVYTIQLLK